MRFVRPPHLCPLCPCPRCGRRRLVPARGWARWLLDLLAAPAISYRCRACGEEASRLRRGPWITY